MKKRPIKNRTIKRLKCKINNKFVDMLFIGKEDVENGANGHKGWLCLHNGQEE